MRLAYQGEPGAYSEAAALQFGGPQTETLPCKSFDEVFEAVKRELPTREVVELVATVAYYNMVARFLVGLEIDLESS